jgi:hypothetical protein
MKNSTVLLLLFFPTLGCFAQQMHKQKIKEKLENFSNQGEQENYQATKLFEKYYKKEKYQKYNGEIKTLDENHILYGTTLLEVYNCEKELESIFTTGIFYPQILNTDTVRISNVQSQHFLSNSPKVRRFKLWVHTKGLLNPYVYFIELTNIKATKKTSTLDFLKECKLSFVKDGWLII